MTSSAASLSRPARLSRQFAVYAASVSAIVLIMVASDARAQSFTVGAGVTDTTAKNLTGTQTGQVDATGTLQTGGGAATLTVGTATGVSITNNGTIGQTATGRVLDVTGGTVQRSFSLDNGATGIVRSSQNDAIRVNVAVTTSTITIDNSGLIQAGGTGLAGLGQAIDWRSISAAGGNTLSILNQNGGIIESLTDDAIRPGVATTIDNSGIIRSFGANTSGGAFGTSDGIDAGARTGIVVTNENGGLVSGARHGITADSDITVINQAGSTILGRNGSGVGSDGNGTVTNRGTITGAYAGAGNIFNSDGTASLNGDGDGVDIDLIGTVTNFGTIQGTGAGGVDSGGRPNGSDGIAMGGGTIDNRSGALISGGGRGILIDDGAFGSGVAATTLTNAGTIRGLANTGVGMVGNFNNTITNSGLISGAGTEAAVFVLGTGDNTIVNTGTISTSGTGAALELGDGNNTVTTSGSISAASNTATAIQLGNGNNTLRIEAGNIVGDVTAGTGVNTATFALGTGGSFNVGSNYTGLTTAAIQSGRVVVSGSITTSNGLTVNSGAVLAGSGTVGGNVALASGSTIAPGNSPGTLTIGGNLTVANGSTYQVEVVPGSTVSDRIDVGGVATLNGGLVQTSGLDDAVPQQTYTILTAQGGVTGRFSSVTPSRYLFLGPQFGYSANAVTLRLDRNGVSFASVTDTPNQRAAATGLDGLTFSNAAFTTVAYSNAPAARAAFDQLSGEVHASAKTGQIEDARFIANTAMDRIDAAFTVLEEQGADPVEGSVALASTGIEAWISGYGSWGETDGDGNAASIDRDIGGFLVGADGFLAETLRVGLLAGYSEASYDVDGRASSADVDSTHVGIYAGTMLGNVSLKAGASYSFNEIDTSREIAFGTFRDSVTASYDSGTAQVFGEASYRFDTGFGTSISPFANLTYVSLDTDDFAERGGAAALRSNGATTETTFSTLGFKGQAAMPIGGLAVNATGTLGWRHAFDDRTPTDTLAFVAGGPAFAVSGVPIAEDAAVVEFGLGVDVAPNATVGLHYAGQFAEDATDNGVRATLDVKF